MENLKKLRTARHMSQQKLADEFNLSQQSIYKYENNLSEPDIQTMKGFATFFHTSIDYLIGYEHDEIPQKENLSPDELHIVLVYRKLPGNIREHVLKIMEALAKSN